MIVQERDVLLREAQTLLHKPDFSKEDRSRFDALLAMFVVLNDIAKKEGGNR
jgi:hypothetical protein